MHLHHHDSHDHAHGHHGPSLRELGPEQAREQSRRLQLALGITAVVMVAQIVGGLVANSLALLADAGHMATDVAALGLSLFVVWFSRRPVTATKTYGYLRWEILAAFLNGVTLLLLALWIVWEAAQRLLAPQPVAGGLMLAVAIVGLAANIAAALILRPATGSLNVRGAYLHVLGDLLGSVGTVSAALAIQLTGWVQADPIASVLVMALVIRAAWRLVRESVDILLESTPAHISLGEVRQRLEAISGVESVHDLHVWTVTSGVYAMSAHAVAVDIDASQQVLNATVEAMREFGIEHVTIQVECGDCPGGVHIHD
jgi:cobalt-zinc-cadmium efflux system protein